LLGLAVAAFILSLILKPKPHPLLNSQTTVLLGMSVGVTTFIIVYFVRKLRKASSPEYMASQQLEQIAGEFGRIKVVLTPEEYIHEYPSGRDVRRWHVFSTIEATAEYVFFFSSATKAYLIPRRAFQDEEAYENFIRTACSYHTQALEAERRFGKQAKGGSSQGYYEKGGDADQGITQ
jgi:hypothetical protein